MPDPTPQASSPKPQASSRRIVITGIGWITPLGHDIETVWSALLASRSGIRPIRHFDAATFPTTFAAQVVDYDYRRHVNDPAVHERVSPNTGFALGAATQAWRSAGLADSNGIDHERLGVYLGAGEGTPDFDAFVSANVQSWNTDDRGFDVSTYAKLATTCLNVKDELEQEPNMPLAHIAREFQALGPTYNCLTACAASTQAIGEATEIIRRGDADVMISGGAHTMIHPLGVTGFNRLTALSNRNDDHKTASRPFSRDRDGFVLGEGAGMLIIESLDHVRARGDENRVLAEVAGYGSTADAYRITDIHPDGRGAAKAMKDAIDAAGLTVADIDYISAHGTGTKENDSIETHAIKRVFADHAASTPVSSVKSMLGHLIAAAGAVEAITCILAIRDGKLPPTINLQNPDPECDLDYVANKARDAKVNACLSNSFGFGGQNDALVLRRFEG